MRTPKIKSLFLAIIVLMLTAACGPVLVTSRQGPPPPPWFYPNRVEVVRYVYFPELTLYFDLRSNTYIYLEGATWVRRNRLPERYLRYDLGRQRYHRIRGYQGEDIREYHNSTRRNSGRSNRNSQDPA